MEKIKNWLYLKNSVNIIHTLFKYIPINLMDKAFLIFLHIKYQLFKSFLS